MRVIAEATLAYIKVKPEAALATIKDQEQTWATIKDQEQTWATIKDQEQTWATTRGWEQTWVTGKGWGENGDNNRRCSCNGYQIRKSWMRLFGKGINPTILSPAMSK